MRNTISGFLAGIAASCIAFWLLGSDSGPADSLDPRQSTPAAADASSPTAAGNNGRRGENPGDDRPREETPAPITDTAPDRRAVPENNDERIARLQASISVTQRALEDLRDELMDARLDAEPIVTPVSLPDEFEWIYENDYRGLFHEELQREPIDAQWAGPMEARLQAFLYDRPDMIRRYGAPSIHCHSTKCEVTFLAYGNFEDPSITAAFAGSLFNDAHEEMPGMFDCRAGSCWADSSNQDGVITIFWGMSHKGDQQTQGAVRVAAAPD